MKLVMFSPMTLSSAIGRVTRLVVGSLVEKGHDVLVVRTEDRGLLETRAHGVPASIIDWTGVHAVRDAVTSADAVVYAIGNHYGFHRGCIQWLPTTPGIVCLHDYFLGGLFHAWAQAHRQDARSVLRAWYGDDVARRYLSIDPRAFIEETFDDAPMTEWVASLASAVITHSAWGISRVLVSCPGPVRVVPLPYDAPTPAQRVDQDPGPEPRFTVLTVGHINANKRVASVIRSIGQSDRLRRVTLYRLVGRIEPAMKSELTALADGLGVALSISGEVDDDALREAVAESDVVCSLRYPTLEAASASAIEAMLYGKAVVVLDTGFYHELPDEYVRKVRVDREIPDLRRTLEKLQGDAAQRRRLGQAAAGWAKRTFRADTYADRLVELAAEVSATAPALEATREFADTLAAWGGSELLLTRELVGPLQIFEGRP